MQCVSSYSFSKLIMKENRFYSSFYFSTLHEIKRTQKSACKYLCKLLSKLKSKNSVSQQRITLPKQVDEKLMVVKGILKMSPKSLSLKHSLCFSANIEEIYNMLEIENEYPLSIP